MPHSRKRPDALSFTVTVDENGEFNPIRTEDLPVSGRDGDGQKTPTVREMSAILASLPEQFQDLPLTRYCDEGVAGITYRLHYEREASMDDWTAHVGLW